MALVDRFVSCLNGNRQEPKVEGVWGCHAYNESFSYSTPALWNRSSLQGPTCCAHTTNIPRRYSDRGLGPEHIPVSQEEARRGNTKTCEINSVLVVSLHDTIHSNQRKSGTLPQLCDYVRGPLLLGIFSNALLLLLSPRRSRRQQSIHGLPHR